MKRAAVPVVFATTRQTAAAQRARAQPGDRALAPDAVDQHAVRDALQISVVVALLDHSSYGEYQTGNYQNRV